MLCTKQSAFLPNYYSLKVCSPCLWYRVQPAVGHEPTLHVSSSQNALLTFSNSLDSCRRAGSFHLFCARLRLGIWASSASSYCLTTHVLTSFLHSALPFCIVCRSVVCVSANILKGTLLSRYVLIHNRTYPSPHTAQKRIRASKHQSIRETQRSMSRREG